MKTNTTQFTHSRQNARWPYALATLTSLAIFATACGDTNEPDIHPPLHQSAEFSLLPAQSCDTIRERLTDATTEQILEHRYANYYWRGDNNASDDSPPVAAPEAGSDADNAPDDYTETNVQEAGVDEPDIIKTDGKFIYTTHGTDLVIMKSWPANETQIVGRYNLGQSIYANSLFLQGDRVAVFSNIYEYNYYDVDYEGDNADGDYERPGPNDYFYGTRITILDVSDRTNPTLENQLDVEGWMNSARMIDGKVYLVSNSQLNSPVNAWSLPEELHKQLPANDWTEDTQLREQRKNQARPIVRAYVAQQLADIDIKSLMPRARTSDSTGQITATHSIYECNDLYMPSQITTLGMLNISSFDLSADQTTQIESTGLLADGWTVYASRQSLYIAMSSHAWWWGFGNAKNESHIHKFELPTGKPQAGSKPRYTASGKVDGWLLNQFAMSEYDGHLRVATTDNQWEWNSGDGTRVDNGGNNLIILQQQGSVLEEVGAVRGLAPGEQIYAIRMIADKGYMVTFFQVDPLYTFDLSNPTAPKMLGELKIPGYSSYIHPIADDSLLTIGMDGDDTGRITGLQLQIFDVSDMKNPTRSHQHLISTGSGWWSSHSEALYNHHAFTYDAKREILAIPVSIYDNDYRFTGLILFKANATDGIQEIGRVSHGDLVHQAYCHDQNRDYGCDTYDGWNWWSQMRRSIFMGAGEGDTQQDYVYSLSSVGLKVNDLYTPQNEHASVLLR